MISFIKKLSVNFLALSLLILVAYIISNTAFAQQEYQPLAGIPGVTDDQRSLATYISALFLLAISVGALLAVIKIAIAGIQYMMDDVVTKKQDAKDDIAGALLGLAILLATFVVLYTINPNLVQIDFLSSNRGGSAGQVNTPGNQNNTPPIECTGADVELVCSAQNNCSCQRVSTLIYDTDEQRDDLIQECENRGGSHLVTARTTNTGTATYVECRAEVNAPSEQNTNEQTTDSGPSCPPQFTERITGSGGRTCTRDNTCLYNDEESRLGCQRYCPGRYTDDGTGGIQCN